MAGYQRRSPDFFERANGEISHKRLTKELRKSLVKSEARAAAGALGGAAKALKTRGSGMANDSFLPEHLPESRNQTKKAAAFPAKSLRLLLGAIPPRSRSDLRAHQARSRSDLRAHQAKTPPKTHGDRPVHRAKSLRLLPDRLAGISPKPTPTPPTPSSRRS
ncbi:hypothetical protein LGH82_29445 [Mesorhizobium sp. PAMC28654]|uniref:hypothetical protein n=1 Tax=Mesorhizobium sp. PAMC28654 TaxID=2880934 RepID=UPI001D0BD7C7|nr:hypothetical protein [Mesorhizobium sp. PAMC28654]UDL89152.1 hypothetical protein LGH82_29445 [Mesorhizobium sp. PAMC28654]